MKEGLTAQQQLAVTTHGRSLLVSAAAGSGKTMVLVERLFSYVEQEGADLDDFLIITYTRAAASELRGKIAKALEEHLRRQPENEHLRRQLLRVYRAEIKTVDAFCTALLRENCHLLQEDAAGRTLRPDFRVLDETEADVLRRQVLERVLDGFYETMQEGDGASLLADTLGAGRDDRALAALVLELYGKLQAQSEPERWLDAQAESWANLPENFEQTPYGDILLGGVRRKALYWENRLRAAADEMQQEDVLARQYAPSFLTAAERMHDLAGAAGWNEARACCGAEIPALGRVMSKDATERKERMKALWDTFRASRKKMTADFDLSSEEAMEDLRRMAPAMEALLRLTADFSARYQTEKRRRNAADFSDQEHEALRLLSGADGQGSELARETAQRYREIMVDEYQDTNEVQNRIFSAISRAGQNLFTVGDVKQSIYRFRLADPGIFLERYRRYPDLADAAEGESARLLLNRNFRSRPEVLDAANFVFSHIMTEEMGELNYGEDEKLNAGAVWDDRADAETEFHLLDLSDGEDEEGRSAARAEADFVAERIRGLLADGFPVRDGADERPIREDDIVILMRSPGTHGGEYRRALEERNIACAFDGGEDFYGTMEIAVLFALLTVVDNPRQDIPLISVLHSPLFGFSPDRLAELRGAARDGDFYDALLQDESEDTRSFLALLHALRQEARELSIHEFLFSLYDRCRMLAIFGAMPGGREKKENLIAFSELAKEIETAGHRSLYSFVCYLRSLLETGHAPIPQVAHSAQGVRIMSIHASKGLEFPVVILAGLARRFSQMDFRSSVLVHSRWGLGPECVDTVRSLHYPTLARKALEDCLRREAKAEEMRLLYVAMTRAKEKLILVHTQHHAASRISDLMSLTALPPSPETVGGRECMGDWVLLPLLCRTEAAALRSLADFDLPYRYAGGDRAWRIVLHGAEAGKSEAECAGEARSAPALRELTPDAEALSYRYPYESELNLPAKLTVTQLKGRQSDGEIAESAARTPRLRALQKPRFLAGETALRGAERGTAMHLAVQLIDWNAAKSVESVREQVEAFAARRLLTREQADAVDAAAIAAFARSELAERICKAPRVEREYRFSLLRPAHDFTPEAGDSPVLLQGVVDCFFEEDGELTVLDFKTDRVTREELDSRAEEYRAQLENYAQALSAVLERPVREKILYFFSIGEKYVL